MLQTKVAKPSALLTLSSYKLIMNFKHFSFIICLLFLVACQQDYSVSKIEGKRISISDSLGTNQEFEAFIKPFREKVTKDLDSTIAIANENYSKKDGELNTAIGNFMADAVLELSNPIFKKRTGKTIDFVLLNHGGIRSIISEGPISSRTAYQVMPFENEVVVAPMKAEQVKEMINYLTKAKRAHPISGLQIELNNDYSLSKYRINDAEIDTDRTYYVATSDYLYNGGDRMSFLKSNDTVYNIDYKIRNLLIDYFKKIDTLKPTIDNRFIRL